MICLNSKREKGLWTWVGLNFPLVSTKREEGLWTWVGLNFPLVSTKVLRLALVVRILLQFQSRDILGLALVEGVLQGMGAILDIREKDTRRL